MELSRIAASSGLKWLVEEIERQIGLGRQTLRKIKTGTIDSLHQADYRRKPKGKPATFVVAEEYSAQEKLRLLVEAIESASCGLSYALIETFIFLSEKVSSFSYISFASENSRSPSATFDRAILQKKNHAMKLEKLLRELKEAI